MRMRSLNSYYTSTDMIADAKRAYPGVNWRYLFTQHGGTSGESELKFGNATTWGLQMDGRQDAMNALQMGEGTAFLHLDSWVESD